MTFQVQDIRSSTLNKRPVATELLFGQTAVNYNDDSPGVFIRTTENKLAKLGPTTVSSSTPTVPDDVADLSPGEMWLNTTNSVLYVWSGLSWVGVSEVGFPAATTTTLGGVIVGGGLNVSSNGTISATPGAIAAATTSTLGGVIVGSGLLVQADGTLSASPQNLSPATTTTLGGVIVGSGLTVAGDGTLTNSNPTQYSLPAATVSVLGGIKVGSGLTVAGDGTLTNSNPTQYSLPAATASTLGGIKVGSGLAVTADGTLSGTSSYILPAATASTLGGVKVGSGLAVTADGTISSLAGGGSVTSVTAGTGLETSPSGGITGSGSMALADTAVTAGTYTNTNLTVDAQGRITAASNGSVDDGTF